MAQACGHHHPGEDRLSGEGLTYELARTEQRLGAAGERLTAPRRRVLELLLESGQPIKAYDLMAAFQPGAAPAKPPTVYRALEFLERQGLVHRIQSLNAYVACAREAEHAAAFLICDCCGDTAEVEPPAAALMRDAVAETGFQLSTVTIEARGLCAACKGLDAA